MHEVQPPGFVGVINSYDGDPNVINHQALLVLPIVMVVIQM